ncbi:MAG: type IV secretion system protein [Acidobacteriaceae bacterium]|nr:type IV secretion system protein [Acidobacteriaceae bacterium]
MIPLLAFAAPTSSSDLLYEMVNNITNLTTQNGGVLTHLGMVELSFIAMFVLIGMVVRWNTQSMTIGLHHHPVTIGDLMHFLVMLLICLTLETYWSTPLPGTSMGFNKVFPSISQSIVAALDQNSLKTLTDTFNTLIDNNPQPSALSVLEALIHSLIELVLGICTAVLFLLNCSSFILYAVSALFGPLFIPLLMTKNLKGKFYHFIDCLIGFAMIRAVAGAFIFVWSGFLNTFVTRTFHGDYSMEMWLANLVPFLCVFLAFILNILFVPQLTQAIFGGSAGLTAGAVAVGAKVAGAI